jgi:hypothetical protein
MYLVHVQQELEAAMRKVVFAILLALPALALGEKAPNPAEYTITVHVQSSRLADEIGLTRAQLLKVVIDGKNYQLESNLGGLNLLRVGDYKAKVLPDKHTWTYEYELKYEFLFPDGKTREFIVVGEGALE